MNDFKLTFSLNGVPGMEPEEIQKLGIEAVFAGEVQPSISLGDVTFSGKAAHKIIEWKERGIAIPQQGPGLMEAMSGKINVTYKGLTQEMWDGYLDFAQGYEELKNGNEVKVKLVLKDSLEQIETKLSALSFGYLESIKVITPADYVTVKTVVKRFDRAHEALTISLAMFSLVMQAKQLKKDVQNDVVEWTNSAGVFTPWFVEAIVVHSLFAIALIAEFVILEKKIIDLINPIPHNNKAMTYRKLCERMYSKLGYGFRTSIQDIDKVVLPSKPDEKGLTKGIPHPNDEIDNCKAFQDHTLKQFNAKIAVLNGNVEMHCVNSNYWTTNSSYTIAPALTESVKYNIQEYKANRVYAYLTDQSDEWTSKNFSGTITENITGPGSIANKLGYSLNKGLERVDFGIALGNHSGIFDNLVIPDKALAELQKVVDTANEVLGEAADVINKAITDLNKVLPASQKVKAISFTKIVLPASPPDVLVVSAKSWNLPKSLYVVNGFIPTNHRKLWNAEVVRQRYFSSDSFMPDNPLGQKRLFEKIKVPFTIVQFRQLLQNSWAKTYNGQVAKVTRIDWKPTEDEAEIDYWIHEVWERNFKELIRTP